jgi:hypothetical protein
MNHRSAARRAAVMLVSAAWMGACGGATPAGPQATPPAVTLTAPAPTQPQPLQSPVQRSPAMDSPLDTPSSEPDVIGLAGVDAVALQLDKSAPPRLVARVTGYLGDSCTRLGDIQQLLQGKVLQVSIKTARPAGRMCAQVIKDFEQEVVLETAGLAPGDYAVDVNGVRQPFKVAADGTLKL